MKVFRICPPWGSRKDRLRIAGMRYNITLGMSLNSPKCLVFLRLAVPGGGEAAYIRLNTGDRHAIFGSRPCPGARRVRHRHRHCQFRCIGPIGRSQGLSPLLDGRASQHAGHRLGGDIGFAGACGGSHAAYSRWGGRGDAAQPRAFGDCRAVWDLGGDPWRPDRFGARPCAGRRSGGDACHAARHEWRRSLPR